MEWQHVIWHDPANAAQRLALFRSVACEPEGLLALFAWTDLSELLGTDHEKARQVILARYQRKTPMPFNESEVPRAGRSGDGGGDAHSRVFRLTALTEADRDSANLGVSWCGAGGAGV